MRTPRLAVPGERACGLPDCDERYWAKGLCRLHWERQRRTGTTDAPQPRKGALNPMWKGDTATYKAVHQRMSTGPRPAACEKCGALEGRFEWALREDAPAESLLLSPEGWPFSVEPAHYANLCKACHNRQDLASEVCDRGHLVVGDNAYIQLSTGKQFCRECIRIRRAARTERERRKSIWRAIREWARANGFEVAETGRISKAVLAAYDQNSRRAA